MSEARLPAAVRFVRCDPVHPPASELLAAMQAELDAAYETSSRLDNPPLAPEELRPPHGAYLVAYEGADPVAGGGLRRLDGDVGEIKRMYVLPRARSRGLARALLTALEDTARSLGYVRLRLDTGPKQLHALRLYRTAGYCEVPPYNHNPFACFWGEKQLG
ncbi:MAG TPA: GNAT family N-acetyltransferase [Acidimicrobiales bacterium]|nr:GNAT family N-acetyltransferase [Acidimicrobiales bacterium]